MPIDNDLTISVPEAGRRFLGLSRNGSYAAANRGQLPIIRIGRLLRVPVRAMERMLDQASDKPATSSDTRYRRQRPEAAIHAAVCDHLRLRAKPDVLWMHSANGGPRWTTPGLGLPEIYQKLEQYRGLLPVSN